jgi:hypothetical protein
VDETLSSLSSLELHLFISVLHVYGRSQQGGANGGASSANNGTGTTSSVIASGSCSKPLVMLVEKVLSVCDMLTEVFRQKVRRSVMVSYDDALSHLIHWILMRGVAGAKVPGGPGLVFARAERAGIYGERGAGSAHPVCGRAVAGRAGRGAGGQQQLWQHHRADAAHAERVLRAGGGGVQGEAGQHIRGHR